MKKLEVDWIDGDDELNAEEKHLLDSRLADHDRDPGVCHPLGRSQIPLASALCSMSFRVLLRPEAETDIGDAATWHEEQKAGLGSEFAEAVFHAIDGLAANPGL